MNSYYITKDKHKNELVCFSYDEDKALILSQTLKPMFDSIVNNSVESLKLAQLRDSLLPKLMSGELDVSDIDI